MSIKIKGQNSYIQTGRINMSPAANSSYSVGFSSAGTYVVPVPPGYTKAKLVCVGGGGNGATGLSSNSTSGGGGAGGGCAAKDIHDLSTHRFFTITIGAVPTATSGDGVNGSNGANTTITGNGIYMIAYGGQGGRAPGNGTTATGGTASGGDTNYTGGSGGAANGSTYASGGGGAAGPTGNGGNGSTGDGSYSPTSGQSGSGSGGGGGTGFGGGVSASGGSGSGGGGVNQAGGTCSGSTNPNQNPGGYAGGDPIFIPPSRNGGNMHNNGSPLANGGIGGGGGPGTFNSSTNSWVGGIGSAAIMWIR